MGAAKRSLDSKRAGKLLAGFTNAVLPGMGNCGIVPGLFLSQADELPRQAELGLVVDSELVPSALPHC